MAIYKKGDKVFIQGKKYPGIVMSVNYKKDEVGEETYNVRTEDYRSLEDIPADALQLITEEAIKYVEKKIIEKSNEGRKMAISMG